MWFGRKSAERQRIDELDAGKREVLELIGSIWRAEFQKEAPNWKPLPDLPGMVSQLDNMYAGVRGQRDEARWNLNVLREEIDSLRESAYGADRTAAMYKKLYEGATKTLGEIAALETTNCAHIGKRMARMARAELPLLHHDANGTAAAVQAVQ